MADSNVLYLFGTSDTPKANTAWTAYERGKSFNNQINLADTVRCNENFYIGKQWEGVQANGLPTPQINILKRVVGFIVATICTDNIKINAASLSNVSEPDKYSDPVRIINDEFSALTEINDVPAIMREYARNAAVDGDGCTYTYWDAEADAANGAKGAIKTELIQNTRVFFGNPNDRDVQSQPYIQIARRLPVREAQLRAKENGIANYSLIAPDCEETNSVDSAKYTDDKVTVLLTLWRNRKDKTIWAYESTQTCDVCKPKSLDIRLYPITWLCWDYIQDCYHGQAMITGLIPNQIFINKALAMSMVSMMRSAWPKTVYDRTRVKKWDNRVGGAIPVAGGDINTVAKVIDPASISPQVSQFIQLAVDLTEQSLGATAVALGDTRPDNTSAIIALQRAAATPSEMTKQNLYKSIESLFRIYYEFIGAYYGKREVSMETPPEIREAMQFAGQEVRSTITAEFDFGFYKKHPFLLKLDVGASSYYSEIASMQTLTNLLQQGKISTVQFLERIPDDYIPKRRALIADIKAEMEQQMQQQFSQLPGGAMQGGAPTDKKPGGGMETLLAAVAPEAEIKGGKGNRNMQREINRTGGTKNLID